MSTVQKLIIVFLTLFIACGERPKKEEIVDKNLIPELDGFWQRIGTIQTNPKCRISLQERPFKTVPFLGRGKSDSLQESRLQQGTYFADKKSCRQVTEKSFRTTDVDLVPSLKATIQNPNNLVEGVANKGWIRGGLPSRDMSRDNDYFKHRNSGRKNRCSYSCWKTKACKSRWCSSLKRISP